MGERPWYAGVFDDHYLRIFASALADERTAAEVKLDPDGRVAGWSAWPWTSPTWSGWSASAATCSAS